MMDGMMGWGWLMMLLVFPGPQSCCQSDEESAGSFSWRGLEVCQNSSRPRCRFDCSFQISKRFKYAACSKPVTAALIGFR